ncbi:MAG: DUF4282 domain-containing protein [Gammaproteobacteria bacterium]|jgi:hypothetical protein|nr:DUF4282 domain-containing protein [Gammaproteobacteria bacterium]MBT3726060.1 DUF4282 domain-containing protein [Gammaproteobacteria bacterium]MBT4077681.1 DUF4282 domain-containing protein [Gammaproteobacteria bacterium]MBT4193093.1 DUF4282 domain-containing protein [Gammaproteobacteria bacterium]MBT4451695.1 DUF4282 domain-containing protein [Gammaproteobacteria bacterium]
MQSIYDFLDFRLFISPVILFIFYYLGAFFMPFAGWLIARRVKLKYWTVSETIEAGKEALQQVNSAEQNDSIPQEFHSNGKVRFTVLAVSVFILLEIMWRMMFEILMAYFQMRDALVG